jgi:hypothetical protein
MAHMLGLTGQIVRVRGVTTCAAHCRSLALSPPLGDGSVPTPAEPENVQAQL